MCNRRRVVWRDSVDNFGCAMMSLCRTTTTPRKPAKITGKLATADAALDNVQQILFFMLAPVICSALAPTDTRD